MLMSYGTNGVILQQEETKLVVLDTNLLGNVDPSLSPSESDTVNQSWSITFVELEHVKEIVEFVTRINRITYTWDPELRQN